MPDDWVHCLFTASIIGEDYESRHCWVNQLVDSPAGFLGGHHRILLHDLETAKKLGTCCYWAGFVAALHIDTDNLPLPIRQHLENVTRRFQKRDANPQKQIKEFANDSLKNETREDLTSVSTYLRKAFLKVHRKVGIRVFLDDKTFEETLIIIEPNSLLKTTWDYVIQFPREGLYVDWSPSYELPLTEPRIIPHPNLIEKSNAHPPGDFLDLNLLKFLFPED